MGGHNQKSETISIPDSLRILENEEPKQPNQGIFRVLTPQDGDKRIVWDNMSIAEINEAKQMFDELKAKGLRPFTVGEDGKAISEVNQFDAHIGEIVFLPMRAVSAG